MSAKDNNEDLKDEGNLPEKKFETFFNHIKSSNIFPDNSEFKKLGGFSCEIKWHLNNDDERPNKYSRL